VTDSFARFVVLSIDAQGYGRAHDHGQTAIQDELLDVLAAAAAAAGLDRRTWHRQAKGDEELALIPAGEPGIETGVVDEFVRELATVLFRRNCDQPADRKFRLRLAVDHGLARPASNGFAGRPVVAVSRLVGCRPLRQAMAAAPDASLAVILSRQVYTDLVLGGHSRLRPADFLQVSVSEKELADQAWLRVPGTDVHRLRITPDPATHDITQNGAIQDGATRDGITHDGAIRDRATHHGAIQDGAIQDGATHEGGTRDGATRDGAAPAERAPAERAARAGRDLPASGRDSQVVVNEFAGAVDVRHGVIGIRNDR
jgi:hypothetical protein